MLLQLNRYRTHCSPLVTIQSLKLTVTYFKRDASHASPVDHDEVEPFGDASLVERNRVHLLAVAIDPWHKRDDVSV